MDNYIIKVLMDGDKEPSEVREQADEDQLINPDEEPEKFGILL